MFDYCDVAAAIGGKPDEIEQFVKAVKDANITDEDKIIPDFKIVNIEPDLSVFFYHKDCIEWNEEAQKTWLDLTEMANKANLSLTFVYADRGCDNTEVYDNSRYIKKYDIRMDNLFSFYHTIIVIESKIAAKN